ncbi:MAG: glutamate 5-kinase [Negativicutes bacterium]|nr:glutamate 5-kinase [Negativicutes bacterium]MBP9536787.1 glutamate 5-kinase [Negativicutes bacterium]MBP9948771.1 glutamate 5-kinase [Negativicutes bacterium]
MFKRNEIKNAVRVVVKIGTSTLTYNNGKLNLFRIEKLVRELADLANQGKEIILVTSGAVGAGLDRLGSTERPKTIPEKQAVAAIGQGILMHMYEKLFAEYGQIVAQVLLTRENSVKHKLYINSRNTLLTLLKMGVIPVINENDAIAIDELKIGDNDTLSATVATIVDADLLIILSDIEGVFTANPQNDPTAQLIEEITDITPEIEELAGGAGSKLGTGGMYTKIQAAKIAVNAGVTMVIASGALEGVVRNILSGEKIGTIFPAKEQHLQVRKSWLAFGAMIKGELVVDEGCEKALITEGSSLLSVGIVEVKGTFDQGNSVRILSKQGREIARGLANYNSEEIKKICGKNTNNISKILGSKLYDEVIHRDNMVIMV